ncbi:hypothetical protein [Halomonas sp. MMSF_3323]|uniref:hypothetical protein n=1 Tax=Halomonas sp. MMSF_3323 TaxID=3046701 RepID=UPI00274006B5|nr:hypothetical protein [Halomonas sp. MMSF_3323]
MESYLAALSATIAAVVSVMNYHQSVSMRKDRIKVSLWPISFEARPGLDLHIINRRSHKTQVVDYGFIDDEGYLHSMVVLSELGELHSSDTIVSGSTLMVEPSDFFEFGVIESPVDNVCGAYAKTSYSDKLFFMISSNLPFHDRLAIRFKLYKNMLSRFLTGSILYK